MCNSSLLWVSSGELRGLLDTDLHSAGNSKFLWTTASFPCQLKLSVGVRDSSGMGAPTHVTPTPPKAREGTRRRGEREEADGLGMWITNPATSAGNWMAALICIASCIIHRHHFTTVRNITFILQMLIYVKQLIWETSELKSMKDPTTFLFFCLHECDSVCVCVCVHAHTHPSPLDLQLCVCVFDLACALVFDLACALVFGQLDLAEPRGGLSPRQESVWFKWWVGTHCWR